MRFIQLVPGLMSLLWRLPRVVPNAMRVFRASPDRRESMGSVLEANARRYPDLTALLYEDLRLTHREFNESINRYANYFLSIGVEKGNSAIVFLENRPELLMIIGALSKIGAVSSLVNPGLVGRALLHCVRSTPAKLNIVGEEVVDAFEEIRAQVEPSRNRWNFYLVDRHQKPVPGGYLDLGREIVDSPCTDPPTTGHVMLKDRYCYIFTSGTTGLPKASVQTHQRWIMGRYVAGPVLLNLGSKDTIYISIPFCHTNALVMGWGAAAGTGAAMAVRRRFSATAFWDDVRKYSATCFIYVGELCRYLMNQPPRPDDRNNPIKCVLGNGLRPEIYREFKKRFGVANVVEFYGASEGTAGFVNILDVDCTVGMALFPFAIVQYDFDEEEPIRDENGFMKKCGLGEPGLMLGAITERMPFLGYTDPEESEKKILRDVFEEGDVWFNTGDLMRRVGYRHAQFVDRLGDTFRWKGENVSTTEVEAAVDSAGGVSQSAVYGVAIPGTDGRAGMVSILARSPAEDFDFDGLIRILRSSLPSYAIPVFARLVCRFETTATHKVRKAVLKKQGFDPNEISDPLYVLLPGDSSYRALTPDLHEEVVGGRHRF